MKRARVIGIAVAALLAACAALPAEAQYFGQNKVQYRNYDWKSVRAEHFDVYYYSGLDSLALRVLDLAEKTHVVLSKRMGHALERRVPIILYGSHNDFAQTNVISDLIEGSTGGFTEALRNRVVLPFTGSYEDLRHVVVHELVHAVMYDLLYEGNAAALLARQSFFDVPLWFAEGMAEYFSLGMESNAEVYLRDGTIEGYLPPLMYSGGYIVYKQGQSALTYFADKYGEERLRDVLQRIRSMRNFERAFQRSVGTTVGKFDQQWREWLRKEYWPTLVAKENPERFGRRLTDHRRDASYLNVAPSVSPQGDRVAYFSDRKQYVDVYLLSALDGRVLRRVIRGERNVQFESLPLLQSSIAWSPTGDRLALTAKSHGHDLLYVVSTEDGRVLNRFDLPCDALFYAAWSPVSDSLSVVGLKDGSEDIYVVNVRDGAISRVTHDTYDEREVVWSPDGRRLAFSSDRLAPVVLHPLRQERGYGARAIFELDLASGETRKVVDTFGDDHSPAWSGDGRKLAFISDRNGTPNIYLLDTADSSITQLTDVRGAVASLSWSRENDRLVFSAFDRLGFDVFSVREPLTADGVLARLQKKTPGAVLDFASALLDGAPPKLETHTSGALAVLDPDSLASADSLARRPGDPVDAGRRSRPFDRTSLTRSGEPPAWPGGFAPLPDTSLTKPALPPAVLIERGGPFALPDSVLDQSPSRYRPRLSADYAGAAFFAATGYGYGGTTQFQFSDFLGDHNVQVATDVLSNSIQDLNAFVFYRYLPRRWDFHAGTFHFKNYFASRVTTLGEQLGGLRRFSERNFGALVGVSYPFDRFKRMDLDFTQMFVERKFFEEDVFGTLVEVNSEFRSVSSPSVSFVGDNTLNGWYGPVNGQRYNLSFTPSFRWTDNGLSYQTWTFDGRRYWDLTNNYTFAGRVLAGASYGPDAQGFSVGGFSTLRGYPDFDLTGSRVAIVNAELRFPFIQQLGLIGPVPLGLFNLRGAAFTDMGLVWNDGDPLRFSHVVNGDRRLVDPKFGFGVGIRSGLYFLILKLDTAWRTDFHDVSAPRWHFSIGPEF